MLRLEKETDVVRLRQAALLLEAENRRLSQRVLELSRQLMSAKGEDASVLQLRLAELERQLAQRTQELFGPLSERRPKGKPDSAATDEEPQRGHGPRAQPELPLVEVVHVLDEADRACPSCGGQLREWVGQYEEADEVEVLERRFVLRRHRRQKYICRCGGCVETALGPQKLVPGGRYSVDFAVEVAVAKYLDHMLLERQARVMRRERLLVDSQTLWDQLDALAHHLKPAYEALHAYALTLPVLGVDETRWPLLDKPGASRWHAWGLAGPDVAVYRIEEGRGTEAARRALQGFEGTAVTDGFGVYDALARQGAFTVAHCWAYTRRKFVGCEDYFPRATEAVALIGELYSVERLCLTGPPGDALRIQLRQERSRPIVEKLHRWACELRVLPESALGKAVAYMRGLWPGLTRFLENARIPLDTNHVERALRGVVLGRKNHYESRSRRGTEVAALFYSLLESAKLCGVEPKASPRTATIVALRGEAAVLPQVADMR